MKAGPKQAVDALRRRRGPSEPAGTPRQTEGHRMNSLRLTDSCVPGLLRAGEVVILAGPAVRSALECALITIKQRGLSGLPYQRYEDLARELHAAMSAAGQSDIATPAVSEAVSVRPTVPISEAATRLGISRQARRLAPRLGGRMVGGRWLLDEVALREQIEGTR